MNLDLDAIQARAEPLRFLSPPGTLVVNEVTLSGRDDLKALATLLGEDVPALVAEVKRLREKRDLLAEAVGKLAAIRELHSPMNRGAGPKCAGCRIPDVSSRDWPCPTIRALDGAS